MRLIRGVDVDQRVAVSPTGYRPEPGLVGTIRAFVFGIKTLTWLACLLISIVSLAFPGITSLASVQWTPWIVGIFIFGLSHGGLDDEVSSMAGRTGGRTGSSWRFYVWYLGLLALVVIEWMVSPDLGLTTFLIFSVFHFGQGDLYWTVYHGAAGRDAVQGGSFGYWRRFCFVLVRGMLPVLLPFIFRIDHFTIIGQHLATASGQNSLYLPQWCSGHRQTLLLLIAIIVVAHLLIELLYILKSISEGRREIALHRAVMIEAGETLLLVLLFLSTPPILGIGAYFLLWHAPRHVTRLILADVQMRSIVESCGGLRALLHFHQRSLPLALAATGLLLLLAVIQFRSDLPLDRLILPAFIFVNAITVPHLVVVSLLDLAQSTWRPVATSNSTNQASR